MTRSPFLLCFCVGRCSGLFAHQEHAAEELAAYEQPVSNPIKWWTRRDRKHRINMNQHESEPWNVGIWDQDGYGNIKQKRSNCSNGVNMRKLMKNWNPILYYGPITVNRNRTSSLQTVGRTSLQIVPITTMGWNTETFFLSGFGHCPQFSSPHYSHHFRWKKICAIRSLGYLFRDQMPLNSVGKFDRARLCEQARSELGAAYAGA